MSYVALSENSVTLNPMVSDQWGEKPSWPRSWDVPHRVAAATCPVRCLRKCQFQEENMDGFIWFWMIYMFYMILDGVIWCCIWFCMGLSDVERICLICIGKIGMYVRTSRFQPENSNGEKIILTSTSHNFHDSSVHQIIRFGFLGQTGGCLRHKGDCSGLRKTAKNQPRPSPLEQENQIGCWIIPSGNLLQFAMENTPFSWLIYLFKMVKFYSYVNVYQRVHESDAESYMTHT